MRRIIAFLIAAIILAPCAYAGDDTVFTHGCEDKAVALTFDDGPHPSQTGRILSILDKYGVKATFFEIGQNVRLYPDVTAKVANAGHEIGSHTYSHRYMRGIGVSGVTDEIKKTDEAILDACGTTPRFLRPPGGIYDSSVVDAANDAGKTVTLWSIDTNDWAHKSRDGIVDEVLSHVRGGDIILMHDYVTGAWHTPEALEIIIPELMSRGYRFVTVSELYAIYRAQNSSASIAQTPTVLYSLPSKSASR